MALFWGFPAGGKSKPTLLDLAAILALLGVLYRVRGCKKSACSQSADEPSCSGTSKGSSSGHEDCDVFISSRGGDVKEAFVDHLVEALRIAGFTPYVDAKDVSEGDMQWHSVAHAIATATICVPVFTRAYAESKSCLEELCLMLIPGKVILPVFYDVTPSDVSRPDTGSLRPGLQKLKQRHSIEKLETYMAALTKASHVDGWDSEQMNGCETIVIKRVIAKVQDVLKRVPLNNTRHPVGLDERKKEVVELLRPGPGVRVIGIWGIGGIGKTTLAKTVYNQISREFSAVSYIQDVRERARQPGGLFSMQQQILSDLSKVPNLRIDDIAHGKALMREQLRGTIKVLIVLDDADDPAQVDYLMLPESLGYGSRGIITSRDKWFISQLELDQIYEATELCETDAMELFSWHAFLRKGPPRGFEKVAREVACAVGGLPLNLEVIGAHLCGEKDPGVWGDVLTKLRQVSLLPEENQKVKRKLRISYDALPQDHKEIFLDIACILLDETSATAKRAWQAAGWSVNSLRHLIDQSLVKLECIGRLVMHDQLRDMGRYIAMSENPWTRLWMPDAETAVKVNLKAQGLSLYGSKLTFPSQTFSLMTELRILLVNGATGGTFTSFPKNLTFISWHRMPFSYIPPDILKLDKLSVLNLGWSKLTHLFVEDTDKEPPCSSISHLRGLQELSLRGCERLERLPETLGKLTRLQKIDLSLCTALKCIPGTIGNLPELQQLDLTGCTFLQCLPESIGQLRDLQELVLDYCERLRAVPDCIGQLTRLRRLHLACCRAVVYVPESLGKLIDLEELSLSGMSLKQPMPACIGKLVGLKSLELLEFRPEDPSQFVWKLTRLQKLYISKVESVPEAILEMTRLRKLYLSLSADNESLPAFFTQLTWLQELYLYDCERLKSLPEDIKQMTALQILDLSDCIKLETLPDSIGHLTLLHELKLSGCGGLVSLPESVAELSEICRSTITNSLRANSFNEKRVSNYPRALANLVLADQVQPHNATILTERSCAKRMLGDYNGALEDLDAAHQLSPNYSFTLLLRGRTKFLMGEYSSALADLDYAHQLNPNDGGRILSIRRVVKVMLGDCQEVLNELNRANELWPEDGFYYLERGVVKTYMNDLRGALQDLDRGHEILGNNYECLKQKAYVKHLLGDDKRGRALAVQAKELKPANTNEGIASLGEMPVKFMEYQL